MHVLETGLKKLVHVMVVQGIIGKFALAAILDQAHTAQEAKLVAHCRGQSCRRRCSDAQFATGKGVDDFQPGGMAQDLEGFGQGVQNPGIGHGSSGLENLFPVDDGVGFAQIQGCTVQQVGHKGISPDYN